MTGREVLRGGVAAAPVKTYRVVIARGRSRAWIARVPSVPGCHTYGRTLRAARRRIREALGLWVTGADRARLEFDVRLPRAAREAVRPVRAARRRAARSQAEAAAALERAADALVRSGYSLRDAGDLLGVSHQRVAQLANGRARRGVYDT